jgi:hypothetical protein
MAHDDVEAPERKNAAVWGGDRFGTMDELTPPIKRGDFGNGIRDLGDVHGKIHRARFGTKNGAIEQS